MKKDTIQAKKDSKEKGPQRNPKSERVGEATESTAGPVIKSRNRPKERTAAHKGRAATHTTASTRANQERIGARKGKDPRFLAEKESGGEE